jgi:hypothetical protein
LQVQVLLGAPIDFVDRRFQQSSGQARKAFGFAEHVQVLLGAPIDFVDRRFRTTRLSVTVAVTLDKSRPATGLCSSLARP